MKSYLVLILPGVIHILSGACAGKQRSTPLPDLTEADVSQILQRCHVMVWPSVHGYERKKSCMYMEGEQ